MFGFTEQNSFGKKLDYYHYGINGSLPGKNQDIDPITAAFHGKLSINISKICRLIEENQIVPYGSSYCINAFISFKTL